MKIVAISTFIFIYSSALFGQGFYDNNLVLISKSNLAKQNITSIISTTFYPDSSYHPLSNFVFEDKFDNNGNIIYKKYWAWKLNSSNKIMDVALIVDSGFYNSRFEEIQLRNIAQSKIINFNQDKDRNEKYVRKTFDKFKLINNYKNPNLPRFSSRETFLVDTVLLMKSISIPEWLLTGADSISQSIDTIKVLSKTNSSYFLSAKYYLATNDTVRIDLMLEDYKGVWRSYFIDKSGLVCKEVQNIFSTLYYYNKEKLHIMTETYQGTYRTTRSKFTYRSGSR